VYLQAVVITPFAAKDRRHTRRETMRTKIGRLNAVVSLVLALPLSVALLAGCGPANPAAAAAKAAVSIPAGQLVFVPFIVTVQPHGVVTWTNGDSVAHTITTTPDRTPYLNPAALALTVAPGKSASVTFTTPGLYDYFDPAEATWDSVEHRVAARRGVRAFPLAMEGVIWVPGPIRGLPATATDPIPGKDEFTSDFLAIRQGGTIAWYNADADDHVVEQVPGWGGGVNPAPTAIGAIAGTNAAPPNGEAKATTYDTPGLYYYYCSAHASVQPTWHRAMAHPDASENPLPMEAFVLVAPN
jgi:plastocyanin